MVGRAGETPDQLYQEARQAFSTHHFPDSISKARLALNLSQDDSRKDLQIPLRELLARSYAESGDTVSALTQWRALIRLAPEAPEYRQMVVKTSAEFNTIGLSVATGDLQQAEELFREGQQPEAIRRARLALELYKQHGGSRLELARSQATLGEMLWKRRELARARNCLEQAALLGYSEPVFLHVLDQSRRGRVRSGAQRPPESARAVQGSETGALPRDSYPRSQLHPSSRAGPSSTEPGTHASTVGMGPMTGPAGPPSLNLGPHQQQQHVVLPSVHLPDSMVRGGGLPTYDHPNGTSDVLPGYSSKSGASDGLPGYRSGGLHSAPNQLPTY